MYEHGKCKQSRAALDLIKMNSAAIYCGTLLHMSRCWLQFCVQILFGWWVEPPVFACIKNVGVKFDVNEHQRRQIAVYTVHLMQLFIMMTHFHMQRKLCAPEQHYPGKSEFNQYTGSTSLGFVERKN